MLDGFQVMAPKVEGGGVSADVVTEKTGPDHISKKHLSGVRYEDISIDAGLDSKPLIDWIAASWKGNYQRKNGSVLSLDYNYTIRGEREFAEALIAETTIPALDGGSKEPGYINVKLAPEMIRAKAGSGAKAPAGIGSKQQKWARSNFTFEMAGLDGKRVARIEPFTVRQRPAENPVGEARDYEKAPSAIEFPNLKISLSQAGAESWTDWHDDFVVKGNNGEDKERNGAIVFRTPDYQGELGRINLFNCGIFRLAPEGQQAGRDAIARLTAELYCERMELEIKGPGA
jgi:hypothetical protein